MVRRRMWVLSLGERRRAAGAWLACWMLGAGMRNGALRGGGQRGARRRSGAVGVLFLICVDRALQARMAVRMGLLTGAPRGMVCLGGL